MSACVVLLPVLALLACASSAPTGRDDGGSQTERVALTDLGTGRYLTFMGGLYPNGSNAAPVRHDSIGRARARLIQPLDAAGRPDAAGKYVLLSIGMSNTTQEFCTGGSSSGCDAWTFMGRAAADAAVNNTTLAIVNGAAGGQEASTWESPTQPNYDRVRDTRLAPRGLSEQQVQIVWLKVADAGPKVSLPAPEADAYTLERRMGNIVRALRVRYPNLQQVFISSRIYGGYATTPLNPEPYAYESGFSVKWLIQAQIDQSRTGTIADARAGDLSDPIAPWLAWGPYLWADGMTGRSDGLVWSRQDLTASDGTHPSQSGQAKVGVMLLEFFKSSPYTSCWFLAGHAC
jgi:hypothetical protein